MLKKLFTSEELSKAKEELEKIKEEKKSKKEESIIKAKQAKEEKARLAKLEAEKEEKERLEQELKTKRYNEYVMKSIIEEVKNPGSQKTTIRIASNGEGLFGIDKTVTAIETWVNSFIRHRSQIINISVKRDKGFIDDYTVTYWDILVPEDWDSQYESK